MGCHCVPADEMDKEEQTDPVAEVEIVLANQGAGEIEDSAMAHQIAAALLDDGAAGGDLGAGAEEAVVVEEDVAVVDEEEWMGEE